MPASDTEEKVAKKHHERQLNRNSDPPSYVEQPPISGGLDHELNRD